MLKVNWELCMEDAQHTPKNASVVLLFPSDKRASLAAAYDGSIRGQYNLSLNTTYGASLIVYVHSDAKFITILKNRHGPSGVQPIDYVKKLFDLTPDEFLSKIFEDML